MHNQLGGQAWSLTGSTGTMAAALAANSIVFAIGAVADDATKPNMPRRAPLEIQGFRMVYTGIVASAAVAAAGRALRLFKGSNNAQAMPNGGSADLTPLPKRTLDAGGDTGLTGGVAKISTTAGITVGTFTRGTVPLATFDLSGGGAIGSRLEFDLFRLMGGESLWLDPGEILVVSNPAAFDLLLTWQLTVNVDYRRLDSQ